MKPTLRTVRVAPTVPLEKPRIAKSLLTGMPYIPASTHDCSSAAFLQRQIARGLKPRT